MGFFNFNKKRTESDSSEISLKMVLVDDIYIIDVPIDWNQIESDKFRMVDKSKSIQFSATNYGKELEDGFTFTIEDLKSQTLPLFARFVNEGGYESLNDLKIGKDYIYSAFKVDNETQYYYYTFREAMGQLIMTYFILKELGKYKPETKNLLINIGESLKIKIADL